MSFLAELGSSILLFFLVFGMSATVDIKKLFRQLRNRNALLTGVSLQFIILPFLGFIVVKVLNLSAPLGITLLVVTSSPGGSYSNWWCSIFNAELALSVTMTTISTLLSTIMLPVNLVLYATTSYSNDVIKSLDWSALFVSLVVVIGGIGSGLVCSATMKSVKFNRLANKLGNVAGLALITFSAVVSSTSHDADLWSQHWTFYLAVGAPCFFGLIIATWMVSYFELEKPERVAVAVECSYQNTGIATSVAITMFTGDELATAVGVPLFYGMCEAFFLACYCIWAWRAGWTKAPRDENICVVLATSYEIKEMEQGQAEAIEVVLGLPSEDGSAPNDLIFVQNQDGYKIDEESLDSLTKSDKSGSEHDQRLAGRRLSEDFPLDDVPEEPAAGSTQKNFVSIDMEMPSSNGNSTLAQSPDLDDSKMSNGSSARRLGNAVKSLVPGGGKQYSAAVGVSTQDDEDHHEFAPSRQVPISPAVNRKVLADIPAAGKTID